MNLDVLHLNDKDKSEDRKVIKGVMKILNNPFKLCFMFTFQIIKAYDNSKVNTSSYFGWILMRKTGNFLNDIACQIFWITVISESCKHFQIKVFRWFY